MDERRRAPRKIIELDVDINISTEQKWFEGKTKNLSETGICIITNKNLSDNDIIDLIFTIPDNSKKIEVQGKMIWCELIYNNDKTYCYGIRFTQINDNDKEIIGKYITSATFNL